MAQTVVTPWYLSAISSGYMGAMKAMADLLDYGTDFDIDLYGPQDNPYLSIKRIKPNAVRVTFEVGSIIEMR